MTGSTLRRGLLSACALVLVACGAGDRSSPAAPTAAQPARAAEAVAPAAGIAIPATSSGAKPAGFEAAIHVDPKPDLDGVIHGPDSPTTVTYDACQSKAGDGGPLTYLYDFDDDGVAEVVAGGDDCQRQHTYNVHKVPDPGKSVTFHTNVCVVSGNPSVHGPNTYFSCRSFTIGVPVDQVPGKGCAHDLCTQGDAIPPGCDACANQICAADDFCCENRWDGICVNEVFTVCNNDSCGIPDDDDMKILSVRRR